MFLSCSEAVARGHPDKVADQLSDAIVDYFITLNPLAKVACEILVTKSALDVGGELPPFHPQELEEVLRKTLYKIGYKKGTGIFNAEDVKIFFHTGLQGKELSGFTGASDQGIVIGYATKETEELMPSSYQEARRILHLLEEKRDQGVLPFLGLDAKCLVAASKLFISFQHSKDISLQELRQELIPHLPQHFEEIIINPAGTFIEGGPNVDTGLTGRKIVYDSYGPQIQVGGGSFSGKDPGKIDRTGAYYARYVARQVLKKYPVNSALVEISFGIGFPKALMFNITTKPEMHIDPAPYDIEIEQMIHLLNLRRPIFLETAYGGHFGRAKFPWEQS